MVKCNNLVLSQDWFVCLKEYSRRDDMSLLRLCSKDIVGFCISFLGSLMRTFRGQEPRKEDTLIDLPTSSLQLHIFYGPKYTAKIPKFLIFKIYKIISVCCFKPLSSGIICSITINNLYIFSGHHCLGRSETPKHDFLLPPSLNLEWIAHSEMNGLAEPEFFNFIHTVTGKETKIGWVGRQFLIYMRTRNPRTCST